MKRSMMQVYVHDAIGAIALYKKAFDAEVLCLYQSPEGKVEHAELSVQGQVVALCDETGERITGNTMQFCFHYGAGQEATVEKAYEALREGAQIICPLAPCNYSPLMADLVDKHGVRWCLFV